MEGSKDQNNSPAEGRARSYSAVSQSCGYTGKYAYLDRLVPIQRKYCRSVLNSKEKTYKGLSVWLNMNEPFRLRAQGMQLVLITRDVNIRSTFFARLAKVCVYSRVCWLSWLQTL